MVSIFSIISSIIMLIEMGAQIVGMLFKGTAAFLQFLVAAVGWTLSGINFTVSVVRAILLWLGGWLGPVEGAIAFVLNPVEIKRAAILALSIAAILWLMFSTILNDTFYLLINPFFLNLFTYIGHAGFSLVAGIATFGLDMFRRLFQGPTKTQIQLVDPNGFSFKAKPTND